MSSRYYINILCSQICGLFLARLVFSKNGAKIIIELKMTVFFLSMAQQSVVGEGLYVIKGSWSYSDTPHSVGLHVIKGSWSYSDTPHSVGLHCMISPTQRPLSDNTRQSQETDTHAPGWIRTHYPSKREAADPRLMSRGHQDWRMIDYLNLLLNSSKDILQL